MSDEPIEIEDDKGGRWVVSADDEEAGGVVVEHFIRKAAPSPAEVTILTAAGVPVPKGGYDDEPDEYFLVPHDAADLLGRAISQMARATRPAADDDDDL